ncbi:MAG TPA: endonuclease/exonuclease/phosphatase family protein [Polyangia bacterium]|nr:endonuclease/exonuclease/phosphatase family protein [Polyangia bacterium]
MTTLALYLPRIGFALPLPVLVVALLWAGPRRWLATQALSLVLVLSPLMGLTCSLPHRADPRATHMRLLTFNIHAGYSGVDSIASVISRANADVVLLQENWHGEGEALQSRFPAYQFNVSGQFVLISRYPILEVLEPPQIPMQGQQRSPRFVRYRVGLPDGTVVQLYNLHPLSPREAFEDLRGDGIGVQVKRGRFFSAKGRESLTANAALRAAQVESAAQDARRSSDPVVLAGDTNLPDLSWALAHSFGGFQDGFARVGNGFGYTFPRPRGPWMRIDRVMASEHWRFLTFATIKDRASDHLAVVAELELPPRQNRTTPAGDL